MFALQMAYFTVGNTTMAVTNEAAVPIGIMCNVTQVVSIARLFHSLDQLVKLSQVVSKC